MISGRITYNQNIEKNAKLCYTDKDNFIVYIKANKNR